MNDVPVTLNNEFENHPIPIDDIYDTIMNTPEKFIENPDAHTFDFEENNMPCKFTLTITVGAKEKLTGLTYFSDDMHVHVNIDHFDKMHHLTCAESATKAFNRTGLTRDKFTNTVQELIDEILKHNTAT